MPALMLVFCAVRRGANIRRETGWSHRFCSPSNSPKVSHIPINV